LIAVKDAPKRSKDAGQLKTPTNFLHIYAILFQAYLNTPYALNTILDHAKRHYSLAALWKRLDLNMVEHYLELSPKEKAALAKATRKFERQAAKHASQACKRLARSVFHALLSAIFQFPISMIYNIKYFKYLKISLFPHNKIYEISTSHPQSLAHIRLCLNKNSRSKPRAKLHRSILGSKRNMKSEKKIGGTEPE